MRIRLKRTQVQHQDVCLLNRKNFQMCAYVVERKPKPWFIGVRRIKIIFRRVTFAQYI